MTSCCGPEKEAAEAEVVAAAAAAAAGAVSKVAEMRSSSGLVVIESLKGGSQLWGRPSS